MRTLRICTLVCIVSGAVMIISGPGLISFFGIFVLTSIADHCICLKGITLLFYQISFLYIQDVEETLCQNIQKMKLQLVTS